MTRVARFAPSFWLVLPLRRRGRPSGCERLSPGAEPLEREPAGFGVEVDVPAGPLHQADGEEERGEEADADGDEQVQLRRAEVVLDLAGDEAVVLGVARDVADADGFGPVQV